MRMTIDVGMMKTMMVNYNRDYYSFTGLETLLNYYDEIDENMEFDPIAICCDCTEYGDNCEMSFDDLVSDYGYLYPVDEYLIDNELTESEFDNDEYLETLVDKLENETTVLRVPNGNVIVFTF